VPSYSLGPLAERSCFSQVWWWRSNGEIGSCAAGVAAQQDRTRGFAIGDVIQFTVDCGAGQGEIDRGFRGLT
jgi:hypothetical protein